MPRNTASLGDMDDRDDEIRLLREIKGLLELLINVTETGDAAIIVALQTQMPPKAQSLVATIKS